MAQMPFLLGALPSLILSCPLDCTGPTPSFRELIPFLCVSLYGLYARRRHLEREGDYRVSLRVEASGVIEVRIQDLNPSFPN